MTLIERGGFMALVNMTEIIVRQRLDELLKTCNCCKCEKCYDDMLAFTLNELRPQYVNSHKGELFTKLNNSRYQNTVDIDIAIIKAINAVSADPHH